MQDRMKLRSVSFSDEPQPPALPARNRRTGSRRKQTSMESLPLHETESIYGAIGDVPNRLNSLPRIMPHHRRKILDFNRPSSSLAGHYQYLGDTTPDYANLTSISRRGAGICRQASIKDSYYEDQFTTGITQQPQLLVDHLRDFQRQSTPNNSSHNYFLTAPLGANDDSGSPYSPGTASYGTDNSFSSLPRSGGTSILKNGFVSGRSTSRSRPFELQSTVLRPLKHQYYNNNSHGAQDTFLVEETAFYNNTLDHSSNFFNNGRQYHEEQHQSSSGGAYDNGHLSRFSDDIIDSSISLTNHINNMNNLKPAAVNSEDQGKPPEEAYPAVAKPSPSLQIIATRNRPCCECVKADQRAPVCLLFLIFIVVSVSLISGVMVYLKSDSSLPKLLTQPEKHLTSAQSSNFFLTGNSGCRADEVDSCPFGGICIENADGMSRCQCEDICPFTISPLCGSDGKTYDNECLLKLAGCRRRKPIIIQHSGECGSRDPCYDLSCPKYAKCVPSFDGTSASCVCPEPCNNDPIDETSVVCGSNGQDYPSKCHLERVACERRLSDLTVKYEGKCNPCHGHECSSPQQECHVDLGSRLPVCRCDRDCANETAPICASDGKTYRNECLMRLDACRRKVELRVIYSGLCSAGLNQCTLLSCSNGQDCDIDKQGITNCVCSHNCEPIVRPVCANDGNTYDSLCEMQKFGCQKRLNLAAKYFGICDSNGPCSKRSCNHHSICVESGDLAFCECPECSEEYRPVCGGDGVTYDNECKLRREACLKEVDIPIVENAPCTGCANVTCEFYSVCKSQGIGQPGICVCPTTCVEEVQDVVIVESDGKKVCGTDGQTYASECLMKISACQKQQYIVVANKGDCDVCKGVTCKHGAHCELGLCVCPTNCPSRKETLCGTDMNTYDNECEMLKAACERNMAISFLHHGPCAGLEAKFGDITPCYGELPLVDYATGLEFNCGVYGVECPRNSFCHQTSNFAKCCPKAAFSSNKNGTQIDCTKYDNGCCNLSKNGNGLLMPAPGPAQAGCPDSCQCNRLGSSSRLCDPFTGQCPCLHGIGGLSCDRCLPGYWNMPRSLKVARGCQPCDCSPYGSVRTDCEQMSGKCICKPGISGDKCDICPDGALVSPKGCQGLYFPNNGAAERCGNETCQFGAKCKHNQFEGSLKCTCDFYCERSEEKPVCGSDGTTYKSECELQLRSCNLKSHILITSYTTCKNDIVKSTRHTDNYNNYISGMTPSTILVHGLLGEVCISDTDCSVSNSICDQNRCSCRPGTRPDDQGKRCKFSVPPTVLITHISPCYPNPCNGGGTCEEHDNTFTCFCPSDRTGDKCERRLSENDLRIPMFNGNSFVELAPLENAEHKLSIEIDFKAHTLEGILLYAQQSPEMKEGQDYLSIVLVDGHVEFKYDLGSGPAVIRTLQRVRLGHWHRIQAKRWHRDGMLKLDDYDSIDGNSQGSHRSLDLTQSTFVGGIPHADDLRLGNMTQIMENMGMNKLTGLDGCIKRFKIGHREVKIQSASEPMALRRVSLNECQDIHEPMFNPCSHNPCMNGGVCVPSQDQYPYRCDCKPGFSGEKCGKAATSGDSLSNDISVMPMSAFVPAFTNAPATRNVLIASQSSFLELPTLSHVSKAFHIEVWFLTHRPDGLILYNGQHSNGNGDFLSLNLVNGHVQFCYDLGSGLANLTSPEKVSYGEWHSIIITRNGPYGTLQLNGGQVMSGTSHGPLTELNLELPLYLGGFRFAYNLNKDAGIFTGLDGALQRIIVNGNAIEDLVDVAKDSRGISRYVGAPCDDAKAYITKCMNGGICTPFFRSYVCKCKTDFFGPKCENRVDSSEKSAVKLDGKTYLKFINKLNKIIDMSEEVWVDEFDPEDESLFGPSDNLLDEADNDEEDLDIYGRRGEKRNKFTLHVRTTLRNGMLVWMNQGPTLQGDFLSVAIIDGKAELSFNLGKKTEPVRITSEVRVDDGKWHRIKVLRKRRIGIVQVDKSKPNRGKSQAGASILNTDGKIWIGGKHSLPSGLPSQYYHGFIGCVKKVKVFRRKLDLLRQGDNSNLKLCDS